MGEYRSGRVIFSTEKYSIVEYIKEEAAKLKKSNIVPTLSSHCLWNTLHQPSSAQAEHNSTKKLCNIKTISKFPSDSSYIGNGALN